MSLPASPLDADLARCRDEWETGLRRIDFPEVTDDDRVTFLEHVVSAQIRRALRAGRFDLALALSSLGARRVAELSEPRDRRRAAPLHLIPGRGHVRGPWGSPRGDEA